MRNISDKSCGGNQNSAFSNFFSPENPAVYEIMSKNILEVGRPRMTIWLMRIACWMPKATDTHSVNVILINVPLQQRLHERSSMLRLYVLCLPCYLISFMFLEPIAIPSIFSNPCQKVLTRCKQFSSVSTCFQMLAQYLALDLHFKSVCTALPLLGL
jgi:hypothetical protein